MIHSRETSILFTWYCNCSIDIRLMTLYSSPHACARRELKEGQKIHDSVYSLPGYKFKAHLFGGRKWDDESKPLELMETDPSITASGVVEELQKQYPVLSDNDIEVLEALVRKGTLSPIKIHPNKGQQYTCFGAKDSAAL